jgi:hypothetical protein
LIMTVGPRRSSGALRLIMMRKKERRWSGAARPFS